MSKDQHGWNRSYLQAIERLIRDEADLKLKYINTRGASKAQLMFVVNLWQVSGGINGVLADIAEFRADNPHFPNSYGK